MKKWQRIGPTIVSKVGYRVVISKFFKLQNGKVHHFETVNPEDCQSSVVLGLTDPGAVLLAYEELQRRRGK